MKAKHLLSGVAAALMAAGVYANDPSYSAQNSPSVETGSQLGGAAGEGEATPRNPDYGTTTSGTMSDSAGTTDSMSGTSSYGSSSEVERKRDQQLHPAGSTGSSFGGVTGDGEATTFPEAEPGHQGMQ